MVNEQVGEHAALVSGAGDATGGAIAKRFAREGMVACVTRRSAAKRQPLAQEIQAAGGQAYGFGLDAREEEGVIALVERIERDIAPIKLAVFHMGANVPCSLPEETSRKYFQIWQIACFSAFWATTEVAKRMVVRGQGTIPFTGAMTTRLGSANFAPFPRIQVRAARWRKAWRVSAARKYLRGVAASNNTVVLANTLLT